MHEMDGEWEKRRDSDHLLEDWSLIEAKNMMGRRILVKKGGLDRERREKYWDIWVQNDSGWTLNIYWKIQLDRSRRYWASIEHIETPKNWLNGLSYLSRGIENKPRNFNKRDMYQGAIELLSRRYRASIEKPETRFSRGKSSTRWKQSR